MMIKRLAIAYDGSDSARFALERAAELLGSQRAHVVFAREAGAAKIEHLSVSPATDEDAAAGTAREGMALARQAGLDATATVASSPGGVAAAIAAAAEDLDASLIILGNRGGRGPESVSQSVIHTTNRPIVVIPSP